MTTTLVTAKAQDLNPHRLQISQADAKVPVYVRLWHPGFGQGGYGYGATGELGIRLDAKKNAGVLLLDLGDDARWRIEVKSDTNAYQTLEGWQALVHADRNDGAPSVPHLF